MQENEANKLCLAPTLWSPVKVIESGMKMADVNSAYKCSTYEEKLVEKFARHVQHWSFCHARQTAGKPASLNMTNYMDP